MKRFINADSTGILMKDCESVLQYNLYAYCLNNPVNLNDPSGHDAMACLQIALVILALVAIAIATGGTGLVFAGAILGATAGAAAGGTIAASQYYNANGTLTGASESVMGGVANGAMIGSVCGLAAGYGAELLMTAGTQTAAGTQAAAAASKGGSKAVSSPYDLQATHSQTLSNTKMNELTNEIQQNGIKDTVKYVEHIGQKYIVDGHHRVIVAKSLGIKEVPIEQVQLPYAGYNTIKDLLWFD